ncbi:MAG: GNAT family N-acetyltransferase [Cognatishimia sp.]
MDITPISASDTLPLRQAVLWPDHPPEVSQVKGDENALHFGIHNDGQLICTASLFWHDTTLRLRKFATAHSHQGQGLGSQMLTFLINKARELGATAFWFDARENALPFYEKHGFAPKGERFFKKDVAYCRMSREL